MNKNCFGQQYEKGVALLVALILLLMLSLVGVSAMQGTTMQEKMSGNLRDQHSAFNAAEAALRQGEQQAELDYIAGRLTSEQPISGRYTAGAFSSAAEPSWRAVVLDPPITNSPSVTADDVGVMIRVTASSAGFTGRSDVELESTYILIH